MKLSPIEINFIIINQKKKYRIAIELQIVIGGTPTHQVAKGRG